MRQNSRAEFSAVSDKLGFVPKTPFILKYRPHATIERYTDKMEEPIVLKVLKIPYFLSRAILMIVLSACALPTYLYLKVTEPVLLHSVFQSYGVTYALLGIFR